MGIPTSLARAKQLAAYWDNYVNYLSTIDDRQLNIGQGKPKPPQIPLYIKLFGTDLAADQYLEVNGTQARWDTYKAHFANYTKETIDVAGGESSLKLRNVRPARIVIRTGVSTTASVKTAAATKRKYVSYGGESGSIPFGQNGSSEEADSFEIIKGLITATDFNSQTTKISRIKEKV